MVSGTTGGGDLGSPVIDINCHNCPCLCRDPKHHRWMQGRLDQLKILSKCLRKPLVSKHLGFGTADMGLWTGTYFVGFSKEERSHSRESPFPRRESER